MFIEKPSAFRATPITSAGLSMKFTCQALRACGRKSKKSFHVLQVRLDLSVRTVKPVSPVSFMTEYTLPGS